MSFTFLAGQIRNFNAFESFLVPQLSPTVALGLQILLLLPHPRPRLGAGWLIGGLLVPWLRRAGTTRNTCFQGTTLSLGLTRIHIPAVRRNSSQPSLRCSVFNATLQPPRIRRSTPIHRLPCSNFLHLGLQVSLLTQRVIAVAFAPPVI